MTAPTVPPSPSTPPAPPGVPAPDAFAARPWLGHYEAGVPAEVEIPDLTVDGLLREAAARWPQRDALVFHGARTTFRQLDAEVDRFATALLSMGLVRSDRISLHLPTSPAFVVTFLGALRAGLVVVPMNPLNVERELELLLSTTTPRVSVCLDLLVPRISAVRGRLGAALGKPAHHLGQPVTTISVGIQDMLPLPIRWLYPLKARREGRWHPVPHGPATPNLYRLLTEPAASPAGPLASAAAPGDPAVLEPTGGTTGVPKAATLSHRNLVANAVQVAAWFPATEPRPGSRDAILCALPYFHIYGLTVAMDYALLRGLTQILHPRFDRDAILASIVKERPRLFPGAPVMYAGLLDHPKLRSYDLSSIQACISGSAPLMLPVQDGFEAATGGRVVEGYGLTEASPVTHSNPIQGERQLGTVGLPFPSTEARIVDLATGQYAVGIGEIGELCVRGPQVMAGYWQRPDETARVLHDGWLSTGDLATMDEDGFFRIVDRRKELIIVGGINVYPREVEEVLVSHPAVAEAVAVGMPDPRRGEVVSAYVVLKLGVTATVGDLLAYCRANLARFKVPVLIELRGELPKTMVGKVLRRVLAEERAARGVPDPGASAAVATGHEGRADETVAGHSMPDPPVGGESAVDAPDLAAGEVATHRALDRAGGDPDDDVTLP